MSLWSKIRGTIESIFQIGLGGPQLKNNAGVLEARNSADSDFALFRALSPVADDDVATKAYVDTLAKPFVVTEQFDGNNALPANTGAEHFYIVTTTGANASIGQLLWDNGTNVGTVQVLGALDGRTVFTSQAYTGGTVVLDARAFYVWNAAGSEWELEASSTQTGAIREIRYPITNANGSQDSTHLIPADAYVVSAEVEVVTPYSGGASISVGQAGNTTLLQGTGDNIAQVAGLYQVMQDTYWGASDLVVRATISGAPAAGAGVVIVRYTNPNL